MNAAFREWAKGRLVQGRLAPLTRGTYRAVIGLETAAASLLSRQHTPIEPGMITAVIKTFERPRSCARLVESLQRLYSGISIIVVDDSRQPRPIPGTNSVTLPFDSGVGAGRQAGLEQVATPFILNLDDDFMAFRGTRLDRALAALTNHPQLDLVGGRVIDLPFFTSQRFHRAGMFATQAQSIVAPGTTIGPVEIFDKVANFFLARTAAVRAIGWDPNLKRLDHADFFARAKGRIVSGQLDAFSILHVRDPFDRAYRAHRFDLAADYAHIIDVYGP